MSQPSILVVDDEPMLVRALERLLVRHGCCVYTAGNGIEALYRVRERNYDLILSDVRMPRLDGPGFLAELRRLDKAPPPFVFLTGYGDRPDAELLSLGAQAVFGKPIDTATLLQIVRHHLGLVGA